MDGIYYIQLGGSCVASVVMSADRCDSMQWFLGGGGRVLGKGPRQHIERLVMAWAIGHGCFINYAISVLECDA